MLFNERREQLAHGARARQPHLQNSSATRAAAQTLRSHIRRDPERAIQS